ncbi:MAG: hypothetical protein IPH58_02885 [Sphingobacteriales bacterium]|jgi:hypothetical protein|nr:hypothetical protein [Sphingobacteriales bacterium]
MQWKTITSNFENKAIGFWNNGQKVFTLAFKTKTGTIYLVSEKGEKRFFYYRKRGLFKNKIVLENEYGANIGSLKKEGGCEYFELDKIRYFLRFKKENEVEVLDEKSNESLAVFSLDYDNSDPSINNSLLMVSCLYILRKDSGFQNTPSFT